LANLNDNKATTIKFSKKAIQELRFTLKSTYGSKIDENITDEDLNHIGNILMTLYLSELERQKNHEGQFCQ